MDADAWWGFVAARAVPGVEVLSAGPGAGVPSGRAVRRVVRVDGRPVEVEVALVDGVAELRGREALAALRRWVGADLLGSLPADPLLDPLVAVRPALTVPGAVDGAELAMRTVLGQQVSVPAARTLAGRLAGMLGSPAGDLIEFPTPDAVAAAGPAVRAIGLTGARTATLLVLAGALADGLDLGPGADLDLARSSLAALPGIGPWTVEYVALRALRDPDAFPAHDLVLRRMMGGLSAAEAIRRAERWRPWRGLAAQHLWTAAASRAV